jgi:DNA-binding GntR family transcriptional regulator
MGAEDRNLREQVLQQVRAEIISGQSMPGSMYSVPTLATSLGVSSTPVREALLELARSGLIEPVRNRGFKVLEPSLKELRNIFDLREVLELHAAAIAARRRDRDLTGLVALADEIARAVKTENTKLYLEADRNFHRQLTAAAGNDRLTELVMGLRDQMRLYGMKSRAGLERQTESIAEHYRIIELAMAGEVETLQDLLKGHIRAWEPIFVDALSATQMPRDPLVAIRQTPRVRRTNGSNSPKKKSRSSR